VRLSHQSDISEIRRNRPQLAYWCVNLTFEGSLPA
jgi:hypothetical protein